MIPALVLVGCGKSKRAEPSPARDLYTGSLFRAARAYAERNAKAWFIVSAGFGLVPPGRVLEPYDTRLPRGLVQRDDWGIQVASAVYRHALEELDLEHGAFRVVILAGADYADPIATHLARLRVPLSKPLEGLEVGQRLAWFKRERERVA